MSGWSDLIGREEEGGKRGQGVEELIRVTHDRDGRVAGLA